MIASFVKKALQDMAAHRILNTVTVITIGLSVMIVSTFTLFFINANTLMNSWKKGVRILVYLQPEVDQAALDDLKRGLERFQGVQDVHYISKEDALAELKAQLAHQSSILENIEANPLPDAFEIRVDEKTRGDAPIKALAGDIEKLPMVESVEYGQRWIDRFTNILNLFKFVGYGLGALFAVAALFIVANTIRLVFYSRKEEIEIMRLVGATDRFITMPFYFEGLMLGALGGLFALLVLFAAYLFTTSGVQRNPSIGLVELHFFSTKQFLGIILGSMLIGWIGCFLSLKQFLKN